MDYYSNIVIYMVRTIIGLLHQVGIEMKLWHNDQWVSTHVADSDEFDYSGIDVLEPFNGTHPLVMQERIASKNWKFDRDISQNRKTVKETVKKWFRQYLGLDFTYKNYILKK